MTSKRPSLTALVEHHDGRFEVIQYKDFCQRLEEKERQRAVKSQSGAEIPEVADPEPVEEDTPPAS